MNAKYTFVLYPLPVSLKWMSLLPLFLLSSHSLAKDITRDTVIDSGASAENYRVRNGANLTANGATTKQIRVDPGSSVTLTGTTVDGTASSVAVDLLDGNASITGSTVTARTTGLSLGFSATGSPGSRATVSDSDISGGVTGALVGSFGQLQLTRSKLTASSDFGSGLQLASGQVSATASEIRGGGNGVFFAPGSLAAGQALLVLDDTEVEGKTGSAIFVDDFGLTPIDAHIEVRNGSTLLGGNGTLLEVKGVSTASMLVDHSDLLGNVIADSAATANITLQNRATLTGQLTNVEQLTVNSDARWVMVADGEVANLALNGGGVQYGNPGEYYRLNVGNLSGDGGTFYMHNNFSTGQIDTLEVTGTASGDHQVALDSSGTEPVAAGSTAVVRIGDGDARFSLLNGPVEQGAFSYDLIKQGDNEWFLNTATRVVSPGTQSVMALFNAAPTVWYGELSTLRSRMGEVRQDGGKAGGWMRTYGNKFDVNASSGTAYQQTQRGLSFGVDAPLPLGDGQWLVGLLGGYSKSDLNLSHGTSGTVDSYYAGAYTTWLDEPSGYYFDGVLKFNRFQNTSDVQLSDGKKTKGKYDNTGVGASLELGRHIKLANDYFLEPFAQLSGVIVQGEDYDLDNGLSAEGDRTRSLLGKVGATAGRNFMLGEGKVVQPYLRAAYVHEFASNNEVKVNNNAFNNDLSGSRGELGAGVSLTLTDKVSLHAEFDYSHGDKIEQPWGANVGARYRW
ncbi:autotransporter outer membrane beta-barrel domain-containing protein [Pseudomonas sp. Irchel s3b6]|uniref:autotransporter outer membrane beta-barrel domain-containing protein n=1 Tax=Pseudomonas sp. Irchel s3b6 TaxID=2009078 RepID=UPI000BA458F1|nr:autotransporter outer membrane beta-barrel domain-containing protein [Pseudomonas sp. Irchel s3b6]